MASAAKKTASKTKTAAKKKTVTTKKATTRKTAVKTTKKASAKKAAVKKVTVKKPVASKKAAAVKKTATKSAPKKSSTKKAAVKKTTSPAASEKKPARKATAKKATVQKPESVRDTVTPKKSTAKPKSNSTSAKKEKESTVSTVQAQKPESQKIAAARRPVRRQPFRKKGLENVTFRVNEQVAYPAHGVGKVIAKEKQSIAEMDIELYVIDFEHEKMKLRVPISRAYESGMRPLCTNEEVDYAIELLQGRARVKRTMWSRRAQEYEAKINSGDLRSVAEVVRDLYRSSEQPEQSYSERQLYEQAVDRMAREVGAVRKCDHMAAVSEMEASLHKKHIPA